MGIGALMSKVDIRMDQLEQFVQVVVKQHLDIEHRTNTTIAHLNEMKVVLDELEFQFKQLEKWHKRMWKGLDPKIKKALEDKNPGAWMGKRYEPSE